MLKCIHQTPPIKTKASKFVTDFYVNYVLFEQDNATLCDLYGNILGEFKCGNGIRAGVFAENKAIIARDTKRLYFYDIKNKTSRIVRCKKPVHALFPGQDFNSFYVGTHKGKNLEIELMSVKGEDVIFELKGKSGILSGLRRFFTGRIKPLEISMLHSGSQIYICDKSPKIEIFSEIEPLKSLGKFPAPIYQVLRKPDNNLLLFGAVDKTVYAFDENKNQIFSKEFPIPIMDILLEGNRLVIIGRYGTIFMLDFKGDILDGGFIGKDIIDCHISHEGLLWCLTEDASLMIIAPVGETAVDIFSLIHVGLTGKEGPLEKALHEINEKASEQRSEKARLRIKGFDLDKKEIEIKNLDKKVRQESSRVNLMTRKVELREEKTELKLKHLRKFKALLLRMDTVEVLSTRLKILERRALEDKSEFPFIEEMINKRTQEIKETEETKSRLEERVKQETEKLSGLKKEISNLRREGSDLEETYKQAKKELTELKSKIEENNAFIQNAPQEIKKLEKEEEFYTSKIKKMEEEILTIRQRIEKAKTDEEESRKKLGIETEKLAQIKSSLKRIKEKEENTPRILKKAQELKELIDKTNLNKEGGHV